MEKIMLSRISKEVVPLYVNTANAQLIHVASQIAFSYDVREHLLLQNRPH